MRVKPLTLDKYPLLFESPLYAISLLQKTCVSICVRSSKEIQRFSLLQKKRQKGKIVVSGRLAGGFAASTGSSERGTARLLLRNYIQHQSAVALSCVCEHLCFISIYFVHLLARCALR